jgi:excisionase family DNA binding protein
VVTNALDGLFDGYGRALSVPEVAALLGMSKQGIYHWLRDGKITGYKVGSSWFILREELKSRFSEGINVPPPGEGMANDAGR